MKSPLVPPDNDEGEYTDLMVCQSNAGFYIGTMFKHKEGWTAPGSRDSGYYPTKEAAQAALNSQTFEQRTHP